MELDGNLQQNPCERQKKIGPQLLWGCLLAWGLVQILVSLCKWLYLVFQKGQFIYVTKLVLNRLNVLSSQCVLIMHIPVCK